MDGNQNGRLMENNLEQQVKTKKIEATKIKLDGTDKYSIQYRTYVNGKGWQDWANDGEISGTTGQNRKLEAIEIRIVPKITYNHIKTEIDSVISTHVQQKDMNIRGWLMTDMDEVKIQLLLDNEIQPANIIRTERNDVLEAIKGYGGDDKNPKPGYEINVDFSKCSLGPKRLKIQFVDKDGKVLVQREKI